MSSEGSSSSVNGSLGANVGDNALLDIETLLFSVRLKVNKESLDVLN